MIYRVPFRLSPKSLHWANDIATQASLRPISFDEYYPITRIAVALKVSNVQLTAILAKSPHVHALQFDDNSILIHPDGLNDEVRKLAANAIHKSIAVLKHPVTS